MNTSVKSTQESDLAINGGAPVRVRPLPPWPKYAEDEIEAVEAVLRSGNANYWNGGEGVTFELEFADYLGREHAVTLANGTVALELGLHVLGIGAGDEVIVTPRSFFASASTILLRGARPVFVDVDCDSQNITAAAIEPALTKHTRAIMLVHLAGWPCDMGSIMEIANANGLAVIEDCESNWTTSSSSMGAINGASAIDRSLGSDSRVVTSMACGLLPCTACHSIQCSLD